MDKIQKSVPLHIPKVENSVWKEWNIRNKAINQIIAKYELLQ